MQQYSSWEHPGPCADGLQRIAKERPKRDEFKNNSSLPLTTTAVTANAKRHAKASEQHALFWDDGLDKS